MWLGWKMLPRLRRRERGMTMGKHGRQLLREQGRKVGEMGMSHLVSPPPSPHKKNPYQAAQPEKTNIEKSKGEKKGSGEVSGARHGARLASGARSC